MLLDAQHSDPRSAASRMPQVGLSAMRERAVAQVAAGDGRGWRVTSSMCGRLGLEMSCALLGALLGCCSAPELRHRRQQQAAEPEPLGISERCSARVEEFGAFADVEGAEWSVFRLYVDHNDGAVFGDEGEANVYELYGAPTEDRRRVTHGAEETRGDMIIHYRGAVLCSSGGP